MGSEFELEPGESIMLVVRKHPIVLLGHVIPLVILAYIPSVFPSVVSWLGSSSGGSVHFLFDLSLANPIMRVAVAVWWFILWIGIFNALCQYLLNYWVITSTRIVEIEQFSFFNRQVSSFLLNRIQDVTISIDSFFATIFGYGKVHTQTAGEDSTQFAMTGVHNPQGVRDLIMREIAALHADTGI